MKRLFKILAWSLLSIIMLIIVAVSAVVWYMSPERLTPIIEKVANENIDGHVQIERAELTFWSTFPQLHIAVDNVSIRSNSLRRLPPEQYDSLPAYADTLLSVVGIAGGINMLSLVEGKIELYDLGILKPQVNIVMAGDNISNFDIFPSGENNNEKSHEPVVIPEISVNRFSLIDAGPLRYYSVPDSIDIQLYITRTILEGVDAPTYRLAIEGNFSMPLLDEFKFTPAVLALDGRVDWSPDTSGQVALRDFTFVLNEFGMDFDAELNFTDNLTINSLALDIKNLRLVDILKHLPNEYYSKLAIMDTDMMIDFEAQLTEPYLVGDTLHTIPSATVAVSVPACRFNYKNIHFNRAELDLKASIDGSDINKSTLDIETFKINGRAVDLAVSGHVAGPLYNPNISGHLDTRLRFGSLPRMLLDRLPFTLAGGISANTGVRLRLNDLSPQRFHNIYLDGKVLLSDFDLKTRDSLLQAYSRNALLDFGTTRTVQGVGSTVDSMLTVALSVDTASFIVPGMKVQGTRLVAGLGVKNEYSSSDTTKINPFGGIIRLKSLILDQDADSTTVRLREVMAHASLKQYHEHDRNPELNLDITARRFGTRMPGFAMAVSQPSIELHAFLIPRDSTSNSQRRQQARHARSGTGQYRHSTDSINAREDIIDWNVSNDFKTLLRRWDISGSLRSNRAFVFTRSFPLRQRASDIDLYFNTDTVRLNNLDYAIGRTRFNVKGDISNIERAIAGRSKRAKLKIDFDVNASYIDVTELATTTFYESTGFAGPDPDYEEETDFNTSAVATDTTAPRPVIIPGNIDANLLVVADSLKYSDLTLTHFHGSVGVNNNAVNLKNLHAVTDIGSASLSALYWAPDTAHMQFGMGMKLNRFDINRVLSLIPAVDSLLPALSSFAGIINADLAASTSITPAMDIDLPTFKGALKLEGDSLVLLDADTFKMLAKWLIFKNKKRNMIDNMSVEITVEDNRVNIYPFIFDIDRYRLGVMGNNDLDMNLDYHVSVLKSPLPFKFGINIRGNIDDMKIRLGGAKIKPGKALSYNIADSTRVSLLTQIEDIFRRGAISEQSMRIRNTRRSVSDVLETTDTISAADSAAMRREGFLPPDTIVQPIPKKRKFLWNKK